MKVLLPWVYVKQNNDEIMQKVLIWLGIRVAILGFIAFWTSMFMRDAQEAFVLLAIFIFGGEVIRGFTFALLVGIIVGTYSSIFIAAPISFDLLKKSEEKKK